MNPSAKVRPSTLARALRRVVQEQPDDPRPGTSLCPATLGPAAVSACAISACAAPASSHAAGERTGTYPGMPPSRTFNIVWVSANHGNGVSVTAAADHVVKDEGTAVVVSAK
jgi:hypothetical protein